MKKQWTEEQEERFKYDLPNSRIRKRVEKERLASRPILDNETTRKLLQELLDGEPEYIWDANAPGSGFVVLEVEDSEGKKEKYYLSTDFIAEKGKEELKNTTCEVMKCANGKRTYFISVLEGLHFEESPNNRSLVEEERIKELWPGYSEEFGFDGAAPRGKYVQANVEELMLIANTGKSVKEAQKAIDKTNKYNAKVSKRVRDMDR